MNQSWLFDPKLSYYENLERGPFGEFGKLLPYKNNGEPQYDFFGTKVYSPFGIAAGPLPRAKFVKSALDRGFDIVTFKTVRSREYPCHDKPNVIPLAIKKLDAISNEPIKTKDDFSHPLTIANSFGIPSFEPPVWQQEIKESFALLNKGQALLAAFQGTIDPNTGHKEFVEDHVRGIGMLVEAGAKVIEVNLSCPNEGHSDLLCFDLKTTKEIIQKIRDHHPNLKLIVKITYIDDDKYLEKFVEEVGGMIGGITAINTVSQSIVDKFGNQAFPGLPSRLQAGVSGAAIKPLAIDMVKRLKKYRVKFGYNFKIIGVGGVMNAKDFQDHRNAGADFVMGLTGVMWNPNLAAEIKEF
jgi:dihydroorotate dehydrogenase